jgi:hypothetical protein
MKPESDGMQKVGLCMMQAPDLVLPTNDGHTSPLTSLVLNRNREKPTGWNDPDVIASRSFKALNL